MKKIHSITGIAALATLSLTTVTQGAAIYSQDFSGAVTSTASAGKQLYGAGNAVANEQFGFGEHSSGGQFTTFNTGEMVISAFAPPTNGGRYYGSATTLYLDTVSWAAGDYTVTFDVANYAQGANDSHFGVYEGNVAAGSTLSLRVNDSNAGSNVYPDEDSSTGTVTFGEISSGLDTGVAITGNASISYNFTLTEAGNTGDYLVLGWGTRSGISSAAGSNLVSDSFSVDNIVIVPEPGTYALLGGLLALGAVMVRRRR
jgi:hypothetical protein